MSAPDEHDEGNHVADSAVPLDYFAPRDPQRVAERGATASALLLVFSWAPYLCGVVNAATSANSYVPAITEAHVNASALFLLIGLTMALVSLIRFIRARHYPGAIFAGAVMLMQVTVAGCIGFA